MKMLAFLILDSQDAISPDHLQNLQKDLADLNFQEVTVIENKGRAHVMTSFLSFINLAHPDDFLLIYYLGEISTEHGYPRLIRMSPPTLPHPNSSHVLTQRQEMVDLNNLLNILKHDFHENALLLLEGPQTEIINDLLNSSYLNEEQFFQNRIHTLGVLSLYSHEQQNQSDTLLNAFVQHLKETNLKNSLLSDQHNPHKKPIHEKPIEDQRPNIKQCLNTLSHQLNENSDSTLFSFYAEKQINTPLKKQEEKKPIIEEKEFKQETSNESLTISRTTETASNPSPTQSSFSMKYIFKWTALGVLLGSVLAICAIIIKISLHNIL